MFVEVARLRSFSAAATLLGLTQPAVSYQICRLEEQFGISLLPRRHRDVELTAEGERILEVAAKAVGDIDALAAQKPGYRMRSREMFSRGCISPRQKPCHRR